MRDMEQLKKMLEKVLEEYTQKGKISAGDLDAIHKLTDTVKNIDKIEMLERGGDDDYSEYSERRRRDSMGRYSRTGSYDDGGSYHGGGYGYGYRDNAYASGGGYSSHGDGKHRIVEMLGDMMKNADGEERHVLERMLKMAHDM